MVQFLFLFKIPTEISINRNLPTSYTILIATIMINYDQTVLEYCQLLFSYVVVHFSDILSILSLASFQQLLL